MSKHLAIFLSRRFVGSPIRDPGSLKVYRCNNGATDISPHEVVSNCSVYDAQFKTLIEHGDWFVSFRQNTVKIRIFGQPKNAVTALKFNNVVLP